MEATVKSRYEDGLKAPLTWSPESGGTKAFVCFEDSKTYDLGADPTGERFETISAKMLNGDYYPPDAVEFFGPFRDEQRPISKGDRVQQRAPFGPLAFWSMVEITIAEKTSDTCQIGYVTTQKHHGRGIWTATLTRIDNQLSIKVESIASPHSLLFWAGLPFARLLQLRARRRAIEEFRKL